MTKTNQSTATISPLVHAVAGSIGSALSLWLMYPLERARIEMQTRDEKNYDEDDDDDSFQDALMTESDQQRSPKSKNQNDSKKDNNRDESDDSSSFHMLSSRCSDDIDNESSSSDISSDEDVEDLFPKGTDAISFVSSSAKSPSTCILSSQQTNSQPVLSTTNQRDPNKIKPDKHSTSVDKSRLTIWKCLIHLYRKKQLYKGSIPMVTTLAVSNFVFFYTLHYVKRIFLHANKNNDIRKASSSQQLLLASTMAGIINVLCTNPMWVASVQTIKNQHQQKNLFGMLSQIYREGGLQSLWSGTHASLLLVSNPVIQYFVYELGKKHLLNHYIRKNKHQVSSTTGQMQQKPSLDPIQAFLLGASTKAVATIITYPLQLAQVLLRSSKQKSHDEGTWQCLSNLYKEEGWSSLYVGMNAKLLQTVLTSAFTFLTYEQILNIVAKAMAISIS